MRDVGVQVCVRVRPRLPRESSSPLAVECQPPQHLTVLVDEYSAVESTFDRVFPPHTDQSAIYAHFAPAIHTLPQAGGGVTILAYGQTGSGKTHTIFGEGWDQPQAVLDPLSGLLPRAIHEVFLHKPDTAQVFCSCLQIYNDKVYDLLGVRWLTQEHHRALAVHESRTEGVFVEGLVEFSLASPHQCLELLRKGQGRRHTRQTSMNPSSSRSHTIFQLLVEGGSSKARLTLCDLAGSEKMDTQEALAPEHVEELKNINLSLTSLGRIVASLSEKRPRPAAFRECKLTRLLQESLTHNRVTYVIGNVSPVAANREETLSTLKFLGRAKHVLAAT